MGPAPIGWQDIDAFIRRSGIRLAPWEIEIIEAIDDVRLGAGNDDNPPAPAGQPVAQLASAQDGAGIKSVMGGVGVRRVVKRRKG